MRLLVLPGIGAPQHLQGCGFALISEYNTYLPQERSYFEIAQKRIADAAPSREPFLLPEVA